MKKILLTTFAAIFTLVAIAQNDGTACEKAIYVDSTLVQKVEVNQLYWFTGNTEDLPLTVYFFPDEVVEEVPEIYVDFTCEPGVYEDENIKAIVDLAVSFDIYFPLGTESEKVEIDGKTAYMMAYERDLLELLAVLGIDYSIPVYVSFRSPVAGTVQMSNVKTATLCTDIHQRVEMRDTIYLHANDEGLYYFPLLEWKDKDISFTWTGETPLIAFGESDCEFDPATSMFEFDFAEQNSNGYAVQKLSKLEIDYAIEHSKDGNLYVKFLPQESGKVFVSDYVDHGAVTINVCASNRKSVAIDFPATDMALDANIPTKSYRIEANQLQNKNIRMQWAATENQLAVAYFANFCDFKLQTSDPDVLDTINFVFNEEAQVMYADIPRERMNRIAEQNTDGWLFMQIYRQEAGTFSWDTYEVVYPDCDSKSLLMNPNDSVSMPANNYNTSYRLIASEWSEHAHTFTWQGTRKAYVFIADSCSFPLAPYNVHVGKYMELNPNQTQEISKDEMAKLAADYADEFGNLYLRLRSDAEGVLVTKQVMDNTGLQNTIVADGYTAKLVMINQSLYIEVSKGATTEYYDLVGRPVVIK